MTRRRQDSIDAKATAFVARADRGALSPADRAELDAWLTEDSRHAGAYFRAEAAWKALDRLQILSAPRGEHTLPMRGLSRRQGLIAASGLLAAAGGASLWAIGGSRRLSPEEGAPEIVDTSTGIGETRKYQIGDGSIVHLNTDSRLITSISPRERTAILDRGEAWFQVAKDQTRPFQVIAGIVQVAAVGTAFAVRRRAAGSEILVTEGAVRTWSSERRERVSQIGAGTKIFVSNTSGPGAPISERESVDNALSWMNGYIVLDGMTFRQVADEFNRYNTRKLAIDPALESQSLIGLFKLNDPLAFAHAASELLSINVVENPREIRLTPGHPRRSADP